MRFVLRGKTLIIAIAVFVLLIFLNSAGVLASVEKNIFKFFSPVQKKLFDAGNFFNNFMDNLAFKKDLNEVELLKGQIRKLMLENAQFKIFADENNILKKELGFGRQHPFELVAARVLGYDSTNNSILVILQIENEKYNPRDLAAGMPVIIDNGILIGKITMIKGEQIYMMPIVSSQSAIAATVLNKDYTAGVAEGELNYSLKMMMIPQSEKLKQGDLIVTSGLENTMPKGLLIGTVTKVEPDPQNPFNIAYIAPIYNPKNLSKVLIIKNY
ncbi:MAG: rod shape-determining protein MreC [bacterium]